MCRTTILSMQLMSHSPHTSFLILLPLRFVSYLLIHLSYKLLYSYFSFNCPISLYLFIYFGGNELPLHFTSTVVSLYDSSYCTFPAILPHSFSPTHTHTHTLLRLVYRNDVTQSSHVLSNLEAEWYLPVCLSLHHLCLLAVPYSSIDMNIIQYSLLGHVLLWFSW